MTDSPQRAEAMFLEGFNCAQSVLACCGEGRGISRELAIRVAQAFGGGIGRTGNLCGALTGAMMAIGLKHAAIDAADGASKARAYDVAQTVLAEFEKRNGWLLCRDLIGCDLRTAEGQRQFKESGAHQKICAKAVRIAAEIVEEALARTS